MIAMDIILPKSDLKKILESNIDDWETGGLRCNACFTQDTNKLIHNTRRIIRQESLKDEKK